MLGNSTPAAAVLKTTRKEKNFLVKATEISPARWTRLGQNHPLASTLKLLAIQVKVQRGGGLDMRVENPDREFPKYCTSKYQNIFTRSLVSTQPRNTVAVTISPRNKRRYAIKKKKIYASLQKMAQCFEGTTPFGMNFPFWNSF